MVFITVIYGALLLVFLLFSGFIYRHVRKYGYLSAKFRVITMIFGIMALAVIIFSLYLLIQLYISAPSAILKPGGGSLTF